MKANINDSLIPVNKLDDINIDYNRIVRRLLPNNLNGELIVKAAKPKNYTDFQPVLFDATAGLGEDSLLLAASGFKVFLFERNPKIATALKSFLEHLKERAFEAENQTLLETLGRMQLTEGDSCKLMSTFGHHPNVILLDPMFPKRTKSGLVKKKFQVIHEYESPCSDEEARLLLDASIACNPDKIIIKRPAKADVLAGYKPSYSIQGSGIRYDCILVKQ